MLIHSILPRNFRNLAPVQLEFADGVNFISGGNGQGKTNLLESIYWLISLRGKRGTTQDAVKKGEREFSLEGALTFGDLRHKVELAVEDRSKRLLIDGVAPARRREYLENVLVVDFFPEDLLILLMEPAPRRRFLDLACAQYYLPHEEVLRRYKRVLEQRNELLKTPGRPDPRLLDSFDEPFADLASKVTLMRLELLEKLGNRTDEIFREGIGEKCEASLFYIPTTQGIPAEVSGDSMPGPEALKDLYVDAVRKARGRDIEAGRSTVGPHRDDWGMSLDGKPVRSFASRGETRSAMFALHLARFHVLTEKRGIKPVVLIDDVMSELDSDRRARVMELLPSGQVFLTSCDPPCPADGVVVGESTHFVMEGGKAERVVGGRSSR
jgi:DNA replication and repair protein RecF